MFPQSSDSQPVEKQIKHQPEQRRHMCAKLTNGRISMVLQFETRLDQAHGHSLSSTGSVGAPLTNRLASRDKSLSKLDHEKTTSLQRACQDCEISPNDPCSSGKWTIASTTGFLIGES